MPLWQSMQEKQQLIYEVAICSLYLRHSRVCWYQLSVTSDSHFRRLESYCNYLFRYLKMQIDVYWIFSKVCNYVIFIKTL